jgi:hypothetical protein
MLRIPEDSCPACHLEVMEIISGFKICVLHQDCIDGLAGCIRDFEEHTVSSKDYHWYLE